MGVGQKDPELRVNNYFVILELHNVRMRLKVYRGRRLLGKRLVEFQGIPGINRTNQ
jgi:hypothetical protein